MTNTELLTDIRGDRARLEAAVARIDEAQLTAAALDAGWSVKDVLAHISLWERLCTRWLRAVARGDTPERAEVQDVDTTNARAYEAAKDAPLADVRERSRASYAALLDAIERLTDADLEDEQRFGWPTWKMIESNSAEHYREHAEQIEAAFSAQERAQ